MTFKEKTLNHDFIERNSSDGIIWTAIQIDANSNVILENNETGNTCMYRLLDVYKYFDKLN